MGSNVVTALLNGDQIFPPMFAVIKAAQKKASPSKPASTGRATSASSWPTHFVADDLTRKRLMDTLASGQE